MSTPFVDIYCLNEVIKNDNRLVNLSPNQVYALYYLYLTYARSYFLYSCYKDLDAITPFLQEEYYFISDGIDKDYNLSPAPLSGSEFYIGYKNPDDTYYTQIFDYTYSSITNILTTADTIPVDNEVYISGYIIGSFDDDLSILEKTILSNGMLVPWSQEKEMKNSLLSQMIYGGTQRLYSQANHISQVKGIVNNQYLVIVKGMISEYSYKASPNSVRGLGGGLV